MPEWMKALKSNGVDILLLNGSHLHDGGQDGAALTQSNAAAVGLGSVHLGHPQRFEYDLGDETRTAAIMTFDSPKDVAELKDIARVVQTMARGVDTLLVQVNMGVSTYSVEALATALVVPGLDGLWFSGVTEWGTVDVRGNTVVVTGVPEWSTGFKDVYGALRWYLGTGGVVRLDLVALDVNERGQWVRAKRERAASWLQQMSENSELVGTYVRTGEVIATVDVKGHGVSPTHSEEPPQPVIEPPSQPKLEEPVLPQRCKLKRSKRDARSIGPNLHLLASEWVNATSDGNTPYVLRLIWEKNGEGFQLPPGEVELKTGFGGQALRMRHTPCEGSWGFERFDDGQVVLDEIHIWPPEDASAGNGCMDDRFLDGEVQRTISGERKLTLGKIRLEK